MKTTHRAALRIAFRYIAPAAVGLIVASRAPVRAANTDPTLALMSASAVRATSGRATLTLEGSFSFADAVQLALPLAIVVTQGTRSARYDLSGNVAVSLGGGAPQPGPGPGVLGMTERTITLVLPAEFAGGEASAQIVGTYDGKQIASNTLRFTL
jgi:hypothetical protein